jgi:hypothetical protein
MVAERQERYPKGTYKVFFARNSDGADEYCMMNLSTGLQICSNSIWDLIKSIENDLSANRFPQSAVQYRTWGAGAVSARRAQASSAGGRQAAAGLEIDGPTFEVRVLYRQNATWQGTVKWMEGRQTRQFRSMNELLSLMDDARDCALERKSG